MATCSSAAASNKTVDHLGGPGRDVEDGGGRFQIHSSSLGPGPKSNLFTSLENTRDTLRGDTDFSSPSADYSEKTTGKN